MPCGERSMLRVGANCFPRYIFTFFFFFLLSDIPGILRSMYIYFFSCQHPQQPVETVVSSCRSCTTVVDWTLSGCCVTPRYNILKSRRARSMTEGALGVFWLYSCICPWNLCASLDATPLLFDCFYRDTFVGLCYFF